MNCPNCGRTITTRRNRCEVCGQDISIYGRLERISNSFYNKGLEQAKVRNLTGAVETLKKSLEINKENRNARNLLGLVYFEMGETVAALSEWIISVNLCPENNEADYFLTKLQSDNSAFESMNQAIKKYNIGLANARRNDNDLAILQLKRAISMNPKFIRALLLLALIYLKTSEYDKAKRCLVKVQKIDVANVMALRYLEEVRLHTQTGALSSQENKKDIEDSVISKIVPLGSYKEDRPNFMAFLTFFVGILLGVVMIYYMAVPNIRQTIVEEYNQKERDYSAVLSSKDVTISSLESDVRILESKIEDLEKKLRLEESYKVTDYEPLIQLLFSYREFLMIENPLQEQLEMMAETIATFDMTEFTDMEAIMLYEDIRKDVGSKTAVYYLEQGMPLYTSKQQELALPLFETAYQYDPHNPEIIYHLARIYHYIGNLEQAKGLYQILIAEHQDSTRSQEAQTYLGYIE